jgi:hypothetical protein
VHVDHVIRAAGPDGLDACVRRLADSLGVGWRPGGQHPSGGTRNAVIPLAASAYLEVVEVTDREVASSTAFGAAIAARSDAGGGWVGWVLAVDDVAAWSARLGLAVVSGTRRRPDGTELRWRTLAPDLLADDPDLPFLITWDVPAELHPSAGGGGPGHPRLSGVEVVADPFRLADRFGDDPGVALPGVAVVVRPPVPGECPGLSAVTVTTSAGPVRLV